MSDSLKLHGLNSPCDSPGPSTGLSSLSFLQGIFPTQGLNLDLLHCRQILYHLNYREAPWLYLVAFYSVVSHDFCFQ